jgi:hypothetical protein
MENFNLYVNGLVNSLAARGQSTQELLANLFKGYKAATEDVFVKYIEKKEEDYDEGHDIQPMRLMELARNKYKTMVEENKWKAPSEDSTKIITLQAQVKLLGSNKFKATSTLATRDLRTTSSLPRRRRETGLLKLLGCWCPY